MEEEKKERYYLKPSAIAFDGMNSNDDIVKEYNAFLLLLPEKELKSEYIESLRAYNSNPIILNVRKFRAVENLMLEKGLLNTSIYNKNQNQNYSPEM